MESGERELRKAFEDTTTNNVKAIVEHSNQTRKILFESNKLIKALEMQQVSFNLEIAKLKQTISLLQSQLYMRG